MQWNERINHFGDNRDANWDDHVVIWKDGRAILAKAGIHWLYDKYNPDLNPNDKMNRVKGFTYSFTLPKAPISMLASTMADDKFWIDNETPVDSENRNGKQVLFFGCLKKGNRPDYHLGYWKYRGWSNKVFVGDIDVHSIEFYRFIEEPKATQTQALCQGSSFTVTGECRVGTISLSPEWGLFNPLGLSQGLPMMSYNVWRTGAFAPKVERIDRI